MEETAVKVSVVIPVYKAEKYLDACLESVLGQTLREIEAICVDDASPDACPVMLDAWAARDRRVRVLHLPLNGGQGLGRDRGLELAKGQYVYFLDSDDMIEPETLETLYAAAERDALDGIFFDSRNIFENPVLEARFAHADERHPEGYEDRVYAGPELMSAFYARGEWNVYVQRQFWRRDFLLREEIAFPAHPHEDEVFTVEAALLARRVRYLPRRFFIRRFREGSVMTAPDAVADCYGYFCAAFRLLEFLDARQLHSVEADANVGCLFHLADGLYPALTGNGELEKRFAGTVDEEHFRNYVMIRRLDKMADDMENAVWAALDRDVCLRIYGAGKVARSVFVRLIAQGYNVKDFLVTDPEGNPRMLFGRPVRGIREAEPLPDTVVLVAMDRSRHDEVSALLRELGWRHYLYARNVLQGPVEP